MKKKLMKNLLLVLTMIVLCFAVCVTASALNDEGRCGDDAYYIYDVDTKTVTITGFGKIGNSNHCEWPSPFAYNADIEVVIIEDGAVYVKEATCKNGDCVKLGKITKKRLWSLCNRRLY